MNALLLQVVLVYLVIPVSYTHLEFLDSDKEIPYGHGLTGHIKNMPVFEDSVQVGSFEDWSIEDIEIDGEVRRCLCATGSVSYTHLSPILFYFGRLVELEDTLH